MNEPCHGEEEGCPRLRTQKYHWGPSQDGPEYRTNADSIKKLTKTPKPAQPLSSWRPWASWQTSLGLVCPFVEHKHQLHGLIKDFSQWSGRRAAAQLHEPQCPVTCWKGWCLQSQACIRKNQSTVKAPETPCPACGWRRCLGRSPGLGRNLDPVSSCTEACYESLVESLCVFGLLLLICKISSLGKLVSKIPSSHDTRQY